MIFDYNNMEYKPIEAFKGGEKYTDAKLFDDGKTKLLQGRLVPGASIGLHRHEGSFEVIFVVEGEGCVLENDGVTRPISKGMCQYCAEGEEHSLINNSDNDLIFFAVIPTVRK